jgi:hypothetical protein
MKKTPFNRSNPKEIEFNAKYPLFLFSGEKKNLKLPASDGKQVMPFFQVKGILRIEAYRDVGDQ